MKTKINGAERNAVRVEMSKKGWRQLAKVNRTLGAAYLRGYILRSELGSYLALHEECGVRLDSECQELLFEMGVCLIIKEWQGVWYIVDVQLVESDVIFKPLFVWRKIRHGWREVLSQALIGWRMVRKDAKFSPLTA